jgi:hypothetical protein
MNVPWFGEDPDFSLTDWRLTEIPVAEWRGLLFIAIEPKVTLEQQLADVIGELAEEPIETYTPMRRERMVFDAIGRSTPTISSRAITYRAFTRSFSRRSISNNSRPPLMTA